MVGVGHGVADLDQLGRQSHPVLVQVGGVLVTLDAYVNGGLDADAVEGLDLLAHQVEAAV